MATEPHTFDWSKIKDEAIPEIMRQGELCVSGLLDSAVAADARATTLAGIFGASGVALLAGAATIIAGNRADTPLVLAIVTTSVPLLIASFLAGFAGRPVDFFMPGYEPRLLSQGASDYVWMQKYIVMDVQRRIDANRDILGRSSRYISWAFALAGSSVVVGIAAFALARLFTIPPLF